jgi:hypothetical protein
VHIARKYDLRMDRILLIIERICFKISLDYRNGGVQYVPIREAGGLSDD